MTKVLLVEDDKAVLIVFKGWLEFGGYEVITATDGIDGIEKVEQHNYSLVITDLGMPRMRGVELVEKIRQKTVLNMPIILHSVGLTKKEKELYEKHFEEIGIKNVEIYDKSAWKNKNIFIEVVKKLIEMAEKLISLANKKY